LLSKHLLEPVLHVEVGDAFKQAAGLIDGSIAAYLSSIVLTPRQPSSAGVAARETIKPLHGVDKPRSRIDLALFDGHELPAGRCDWAV
jgi:hypothetical protein